MLKQLSAQQGKDGVSQGKDTADRGRHGKRYEGTDAGPQKKQPHAPTGNCFWQRHFTLSLSLIDLAGLPVK